MRFDSVTYTSVFDNLINFGVLLIIKITTPLYVCASRRAFTLGNRQKV